MERRAFLKKSSAIGLVISLRPGLLLASESVELRVPVFKENLEQIRHGLLQLPQLGNLRSSEKIGSVLSIERNIFYDHGPQSSHHHHISCILEDYAISKETANNLQVSLIEENFSWLYNERFDQRRVSDDLMEVGLNESMKMLLVNKRTACKLSISKLHSDPVIVPLRPNANFTHGHLNKNSIEINSTGDAFVLLMDKKADCTLDSSM